MQTQTQNVTFSKQQINYFDSVGSMPTTKATVYTPSSTRGIRLAEPGETGGLSSPGLANGVSEWGTIAIRIRHEIGSDRQQHATIYRSPIAGEVGWESGADVRKSWSAMETLAKNHLQSGFASVTVVHGVRNFHNTKTLRDMSW